MKRYNLQKNLFFSIILLLSFGLHIQSLSLSSTCSIDPIDQNISSNSYHDLNSTLTAKMHLLQNHNELTPRHSIQFSCQLTDSYRHQFNQHIQGIRVGLTPQQIRKIIGKQQEQRMLDLDKQCVVENPEHVLSSPVVQTLFKQVRSSLVATYEKKTSKWCFNKESKLLHLSNQIKFVDGLLSGKVSELLKHIENSDMHIAEEAFNELQQLWPYEHTGSFLDPRSYSKEEKKFIKQITADVMKTAEGKLLSNHSYREKYANAQSFEQIQRFEKQCTLFQQQGNREALHHEIERLLQQVKINGKKEDLVTNVCLAIATDKFTAPITSFLDKIVHAPDLEKAQELVNYLNKAIKEQAHQNNIFRQSEISGMLISDCGFDPRTAADQCYRSHLDYIIMRETGRCYNPVEYVFRTIEQQDLSTAYNELIHIKQQLAELFQSHNITDPIDQQNLLIEHFNEDIATKAHACYTTRSDIRTIAQSFTPIDVQATTVRILSTSNNTQSVATELQAVAGVVLDNAQLCQVECAPQLKECIVESLRVLQKSNNVAETIFHVTVVDHLLTDLQIQSHSIATGTLPTWQRSTELLAKGMVAFVRGLDPIEPTIDLACLGIYGLYCMGSGTLDFIADPVNTTINAAHAISTTSINVASTVVNAAKFACDLQLGDLYLPQEEYLKRCEQFCEMIEPLNHIQADHVIQMSGYAVGAFCSPMAVAKIYTRLNKIDAIGKISNEVKVVARGIKNIIQEHPAFVTAEGIILKMDHLGNGPQKFINKAKELFEKAYYPIAQSIAEDIKAIRKLYKEIKPEKLFFFEKELNIDYAHILGVDIKWHETKEMWKNFGGCHHDYAGLLEKSKAATITKTVIRNDGCYYAEVLIAGKKQNRAFFPQHWSREDVAKKIWEAYENKSGIKPILQDNGTYKIKGLTSEGILIEMCITQNGTMNTAYPFFDFAKIYK